MSIKNKDKIELLSDKTKFLKDELLNEKKHLKSLEQTLVIAIKDALNLLIEINSLYEIKDTIEDLIEKWEKD